jgi:hypothetical protein
MAPLDIRVIVLGWGWHDRLDVFAYSGFKGEEEVALPSRQMRLASKNNQYSDGALHRDTLERRADTRASNYTSQIERVQFIRIIRVFKTNLWPFDMCWQ